MLYMNDNYDKYNLETSCREDFAYNATRITFCNSIIVEYCIYTFYFYLPSGQVVFAKKTGV